MRIGKKKQIEIKNPKILVPKPIEAPDVFVPTAIPIELPQRIEVPVNPGKPNGNNGSTRI